MSGAQGFTPVLAAVVASGPGWAMWASNRRANQQHARRLEEHQAAIERHITAATGTPAPKDPGGAP